MSRKSIVAVLALASLLTAAVAAAQSAGASGEGEAAVTAKSNAPAASGTADASASANAGARADVGPLRESIEKRAAKTSASAQAKAEAQLNATATKVDEAGKAQGDAKVAGRLAGEFGTSAEAMLDQREKLGVSWGNLMIAQTLAANAKSDVTAAQLVELHRDGMGWGRLCAGLGLDLGSVVSAVRSEHRVASGLAGADGRVAVIHGEGARAGLGANAGLGVGVGKTKGSVGAGVGAGIKIGK